MPAIDISGCCIPAECDNIKLPYNGEIASRWDANLLCSISLRSFRITFAAYLPTHIKSLRDFFQSLLNNYRNNLYIISFFIYNRNYPDSVENPPIGTETKAVAAIGDGFGFKFHFWWDFTYILHKLVLFHEKSLYLQKQDYQFH